MTEALPIVAIATGDPAGIGPEISMKAALDPGVRAVCRPVLFGEPTVIAKHAKACGIEAAIRSVERPQDADRAAKTVALYPCPSAEVGDIGFGSTSAASGRASLAAAGQAIQAALSGNVDAVVAAPQNQTSISLAGIVFDGYPSFVARQTGLDPRDVYLMLCFETVKIVHCTLHVSIREALTLITRERVRHVIAVTDATLKRLGIVEPKICVAGLNPHAGEGGLFGSEEADIIKPAIDDAVAAGIRATGPFGADTMFHKTDADAFIVMLHDQGHITAKLLARNATAGLAIGSPILFSSVAHGSGHDIVGKGQASPKAMIEAITRLAKAPRTQPRLSTTVFST
jgi:4-hydroxythreonine-4-phosphate dehydrogenase